MRINNNKTLKRVTNISGIFPPYTDKLIVWKKKYEMLSNTQMFLHADNYEAQEVQKY